MSDLVRLEAAVAGLESLPDTEETPDYVARIDKCIRSLQGHRRMIMSEVSGPIRGTAYQITESRSAERSYNTRALLAAFSASGVEWTDLLEERALEIKWRWTELRNAAIRHDIGLRIAGHEITEDEADMVGENWTTKLGVEAL